MIRSGSGCSEPAGGWARRCAGRCSTRPGLELVAAVDPLHAGIDLESARRARHADPGRRRSADRAARRGRAGRRRLHGDRRGAARTSRGAPTTACTRSSAPPGSATPSSPTSPARFDRSAANAVIAPNFAIGAILMMRFAELAAPYFESVRDHRVPPRPEDRRAVGHRDAHRATHGGRVEGLERRPDHARWSPTARAAVSSSGIPVHAVRLRGMVAHQEVLLGTTGQSLSIRHDTYDRSSFMPGVLLAVQKVAETPGSRSVSTRCSVSDGRRSPRSETR